MSLLLSVPVNPDSFIISSPQKQWVGNACAHKLTIIVPDTMKILVIHEIGDRILIYLSAEERSEDAILRRRIRWKRRGGLFGLSILFTSTTKQWKNTRPCTRDNKVLRYYTITLHPRFSFARKIERRELHFSKAPISVSRRVTVTITENVGEIARGTLNAAV